MNYILAINFKVSKIRYLFKLLILYFEENCFINIFILFYGGTLRPQSMFKKISSKPMSHRIIPLLKRLLPSTVVQASKNCIIQSDSKKRNWTRHIICRIFVTNDQTLRELSVTVGNPPSSLHCGLNDDFFKGYLRTSTFVLLSHQQALAVFR